MNHLQIFTLGLAIILSWSLPVQALELWTLPIEKELRKVVVENSKNQTELIWLSSPGAIEDVAFEVPPLGNISIDLEPLQALSFLRLRADSDQVLKVKAELHSGSPLSLSSGRITRWKTRLDSENEITLANQAPFAQSIELSSRSGEKLTITLDAFEKKRSRLPASWNRQDVNVSGSVQFSGLAVSASGVRPLRPHPVPTVLSPPSNMRFFRLSNRSGTQSFVVGLADSRLVEQALEQLKSPESFLPRILIAQIEFGSGQFNRDLSSPLKTPWSWHISQVFRFAELASHSCDGSPELVEETLESWVAGGGRICFWNYRIVEEVPASQVAAGL